MEIKQTIRPAKFLRTLYSESIWKFDDGIIRLTFDDGPGPKTKSILKWLNDHKIKGYFFLLPDHMDKNGGLAKSIIESGHVAGVHFNHHKPYWVEPRRQFIQDLITAKSRLEDSLGKKVDYCRAPYGRILPWQEAWIKEADLLHWFWSCSSKDYRNEASAVVVQRLKKYLIPGDIVLFHDGHIVSDHIIEILESVRSSGLSLEKL